MDVALLHRHGLGGAAHQAGFHAVEETEQQVTVAHQEGTLLAVAGGIIGRARAAIRPGWQRQIGAVIGVEHTITAGQQALQLRQRSRIAEIEAIVERRLGQSRH